MGKKYSVLAFWFLAMIGFVVSMQAQPAYNPKDKVPVDPKIKVGKLENGMTYYIKENKKPEKRAELMLVVSAGSVLEDDDQDGLAHFCEHMAFNGSKNFPKQALVDFLESVGVQFGPDLNAFTSQDQTVYMIALPTDRGTLLDSGLLVLEDWASNLSFDKTEIDKERGVILEEWRLGKGAEDRIDKKHRKLLYYKSKYAIRDVIGDTSVILRAPYEAFTRFYKDWYRPELMAVIAVGDFDPALIEKKIREKFGKLVNPKNPRKKEIFELPYHKELLVSVATDKELQMPMVTVTMKHDETEKGTYAEYRRHLVSVLATSMLNQRYQEIIRKPDMPFNQFAVSYEGYFAGKSRAFILIASSKADKIAQSAELLLQEAFRAGQHGFTETEYDRTKKEIQRMIEKAYDERDKTESQSYAFEYMSNFLQGEVIPGIEKELEITKVMIPQITLKEVNDYVKSSIRKDNTVITISAPEREDVPLPKDTEITGIFDKMKSAKLEPYVDKVVSSPLFEKELTPGAIKSEKKLKELDITELVLQNGVKVVLKPTNFKSDEILMSAFSPGGSSLAPDGDYTSAVYATDIINESGVANFDRDQLEKLLAGKYVSVSTSIGELSETLSGNTSAKDIEIMMQLVYLSFTKPRLDFKAYNAYTDKVKNLIKDSHNNPESVFSDSVQSVYNKYHLRRLPHTEQTIDNIDAGKVLEFYKDRYSDAGDFTFIIIGNFEIEKIKPLILKYLANLPAGGRKENWKNIGVEHPQGQLSREFYKGIEKKSTVMMMINGKYEWTLRNNIMFRAMMEALQIKLREALREDKGGVYGVSNWEETEKYPEQEYTVNVYFGCNPDRVKELSDEAVKQMETLKADGPDEKVMLKVKEMMARAYEKNLKENNYWLNKLATMYFNGENPKQILETGKIISSIKPEDIKKAANMYLDTKNIKKFVLYPEK